MLRMMRKPARLVRSVIIQLHTGEPGPEIGHLTYSFREAIGQVITNREINALTKQRYFEERVVVVAGLPKSGSSVIGACATEIHSAHREKAYGKYNNHGNVDLRPEFVADFRRMAGVQKDHIRATRENLRVLEFLGVKYIIVVRHPLDQVVAAYCHLLGTEEGTITELIDDDGVFEGNFYPVRQSYIGSQVSMTETFRHMIRDGYLTAVLTWMSKWQRLRDPRKSLVVKYEDFMSNRRQTLGQLSQFLRGSELDESTLSQCVSITEVNPISAEANNVRQYPKGWTGKAGVWRDYLSAENKEDFKVTVGEFIRSSEDASLLLELYPDLTDIDSL